MSSLNTSIISLVMVSLSSMLCVSSAQADTISPPSHTPVKGPLAQLGQKAPDFSLSDINGKPFKLSDHSGKIVVLEWFNPECPFVKYAHTKGPLRTLATKLSGKDLVWVAINSSGKGLQGNGADKNGAALKQFAMHYPLLLDESGQVGKLYGAKTTPHMFIIDAKGVLAYIGAVDNAPLGTTEGDTHVVYVESAVKDLRAGKPVANSKTQAYGCSVKYAK